MALGCRERRELRPGGGTRRGGGGRQGCCGRWRELALRLVGSFGC